MDTIRTYLDNMFKGLPETKTNLKIKIDLLSNMEDKYNELKHNGKSEDEAIGIVISEFGNIDEIIKEFDIKLEEENEELAILTEDEVEDYLKANKKVSILIGTGVVLSIFGASLLIFIYQLIDDGVITGLSKTASDMIGLIPLLFFVSIATGMFIYAVIIIDKYKDIEYSFTLPPHIRKYIINRNNSFHRSFTLAAIVSGIMCILSPISLFIASVINEDALVYGVVVLLLIISVAVYIFIYYGGIKIGYNKLIKTGAYSKKTNKVISAVAAIVWPLAVVIYLISGFVFHQWHINWIVFAITGILYGMFIEAYKIIKGN